MGLKTLILNQAKEEAQAILTTAKEEKEVLLNELNSQTDKKINNLLNNAEKESSRKIAELKLEFEHEKKRIILQEKNTQIERVLKGFKERLLNLNDDELFKYVVKVIKEQEVSGNEIIRVNEKDYNRYLRVFSSAKKDDVLELNLLNKELGKTFNLKLEKTPAAISDGFMLVGKYYDLNFSLEPQIEKIRRDYEREIHRILYE